MSAEPGPNVLTVNAGSSSLKLRLIGPGDELLSSSDLAALRGDDEVATIEGIIGALDVGAVGHRIVHGGRRFLQSVRINAAVVDELCALTELAPLHQPASLAALDVVSRVVPDAPAVACFDTAFHAHLPAAASTYAVPADWRERLGVRRFGFHGLSHSYCSRRAAEMLGRTQLRVVTCHLGAGASLAAVRNGTCVDTTMGFTPLEGLVMATRSGTVDPGLVVWLQQHEGISVGDIADALEHRSGLLGLAGTADMREVLSARVSDVGKQLAVDVYLHRLRAGIAAMAAAMNGLDVLVFTGGVGQNAPAIRARTAEGLRFLGVEVDARRSETDTGDRDISASNARVRTLVVEAREDIEIAREARRVLGDAIAE